ncbi:anti-sigma regulatory factor (Ser/Thr protein kinase) [Nocardiopsis mwathae]|uniref:Anti-sigma regulatory factor (Ser/Thr protein kinase) n=1 Tax=Nocardiopsis mwathae TaxID=1472723 RepID=A0A7W9YJ82_9ACTN|nr:ATP-binding protein [Nocardiopsis mwathae]MBB6173183.1 anti-sigma regulatory factor (Ser/Thr protein kinase) [Nocardiopsis mwathae]
MITDTPPAGIRSARTRGRRSTGRPGAVVVARCGFPGEEGQVREARAFVEAALGLCFPAGTELLDSALIAAGELAANAVRHTRSGEPGGRFGIEIYRRPGAVTIEVRDQGPRRNGPESEPHVRRQPLDVEHGRGLALVEALTDEWSTRRLTDGRVVSCTLRDERPGHELVRSGRPV